MVEGFCQVVEMGRFVVTHSVVYVLHDAGNCRSRHRIFSVVFHRQSSQLFI